MSESIKVPALGESITEAIVASWLKQPGEAVAVDEPIVELETDKITVEVPAPKAGVLTDHLAAEGDTVNVGDEIAKIDASAEASSDAKPANDSGAQAEQDQSGSKSAPAQSNSESSGGSSSSGGSGGSDRPAVMPAARAEAGRSGVDTSKVEGTGRGGRVLKEDVMKAASAPKSTPASKPSAPQQAREPGEREERVRMTSLRKRIAQRLVEAQQTAAILTTFNEVDMSAVMATRKEYKESFVDKHGVKLGFMSFFVKATVEALKAYPSVNAEVEDDEIIYKNFYDIGVAVGGGKGLVVPVIRNADQLGFAEIENEIGRLAGLARNNKLALSDLTGGSFTISNGGIYGSMLSTPILNPPQSGILGLHNIVKRPVAINGQVEIRPIMYLALSYDHRIVDGREAVSFLIRIKECIEDPRRLLLSI